MNGTDAAGPPPPAVVPLLGGVDIPPPVRATLKPIVGAAPSSNGSLQQAELQPFAVVTVPPAPAAVEREDPSVVTELSNPEVAAELAQFLAHLLTPRRKCGHRSFRPFCTRISETSSDLVWR